MRKHLTKLIKQILPDTNRVMSILKASSIATVETTRHPQMDKIAQFRKWRLNNLGWLNVSDTIEDCSDTLYYYKGAIITMRMVNKDKECLYIFETILPHEEILHDFVEMTYRRKNTELFYSKNLSTAMSLPKARFLKTPFLSEDKLVQLERIVESTCNAPDMGHAPSVSILLYGPPGTGKTTICQYLGAKYKESIYIRKNPAVLENISRDSGVIVFEDLDRFFASKTGSNELSISDTIQPDLQDMLQAMDSIADMSGNVIIITANNPSDIPAVLLRPGRVTHRMKIGYLTQEEFSKFTGHAIDSPIYQELARLQNMDTLTAAMVMPFSKITKVEDVAEYVSLTTIEADITRY